MFGAEDTLTGCLAVVRSVAGGLTLNRAARGRGGIRLAAGYRRCGLSAWAAACRSGGRTRSSALLVRKLIAEGRDFASLSLDEWRAASELFGADVADRVTPAVSVAAKRTPQSTAPGAVGARLAEVRQWVSAWQGRNPLRNDTIAARN